jgi:hypothetical protein
MELLALLLLLLVGGCLDASSKNGCITDSDCNPGHLCIAGTCTAPTGCPAVTDNTLYVDADAPMGNPGSSPGCAVQRLAEAFSLVTPGGAPWTVVVRGGRSGPPLVNRRVVPANVTVTGGSIGTGKGASSRFTACTDLADCPLNTWPEIIISSVTEIGFEFTSAGPGALRWFSLVGPPLTGTPQEASGTVDGVYITGGPIKLDHLRVKQFRSGIGVDPGGSVSVGDDVWCNYNSYGLYAQMGSTVAVTVAAGQAETEFNHNFSDGIHIEAAATNFTVEGPPAPSPAALAPGVGASFNGGSGVRYAAAATGAFIDGINAQRNLGSGIEILGGSILRVRNSHLFNNQLDGIRIAPGSGAPFVGDIDLGAEPTGADAGGNVLYGNGAANLCVERAVADTQQAGALRARGNDFTNYDLPGPAPKSCAAANTLSGAASCRSAVDVSDDHTMVADVGGCVVQ